MHVAFRTWVWKIWEQVIDMSCIGGAGVNEIFMCMEFKFPLDPLVNAGVHMRHGYTRGPRRSDVI
jgi:hypothetical protein